MASASSQASQGSPLLQVAVSKQLLQDFLKSQLSSLSFSTLRGEQENGVSFMPPYHQAQVVTGFGPIRND